MPRDISRMLARVEKAMSDAIDKPWREGLKPTINPRKINSAITAWRAPPVSDNSQYAVAKAKARRVFKEKPVTKLSLTARAVKVVITLDPAAVVALTVPDQSRVDIAIVCDGKTYAVNLATKAGHGAAGLGKARK